MITQKHFGIKGLIAFSGHHMIWLTAWAVGYTAAYEFANLKWFTIPWVPLAVIGTAVAFYVGFKNNSAYDRMWEARKIWGAIINNSRTWGANVLAMVNNQFTSTEYSGLELNKIHKRLIYRHIAWLYTLRSQLLIPTSWEHVRQGWQVGKMNQRRQRTFGVGLFQDEVTETELKNFLPKEELDELINYQNTATQIINKQSQELTELRKVDLIEDFRQTKLQNILDDFYTYQGQCERIKKFPLPRQYGNMSFLFVAIFIFLLPLGMISEFAKIGTYAVWLSVPFTIIVGWVYLMMELVGDYTENPFEGLGNDIPMLSLCRTIEIDLKEMLKEDNIPTAIEPKKGVLM
jgi:putative membrane protein